MTLDEIKELIAFAKSNGLTELEVDGTKFKISPESSPEPIKIPDPLSEFYGALSSYTPIQLINPGSEVE